MVIIARRSGLHWGCGRYEVYMSDYVASEGNGRPVQGLVNCVPMSSDKNKHWVARLAYWVLCSTHGTSHMSLSSRSKATYHAQQGRSH